MQASFLTRWFSDHAVKAICWTLIHSLWIGMICALFAGLLISYTRKSTANLRYRALCTLLVLFVMSMGLTYYFQVSTPGVKTQVINTGNFEIKQTDTTTIDCWAALPMQGIINQGVDFLNQHMNTIFLVWLLFFILKSLGMAGGLFYILRIRNFRIHLVAEEFEHKITMFSSQIGIRQTVCLMQSELVKMPVTVGWLKPVILLPMGIILQLPAEQLESILWHELAHIRRRDYLVNILQELVETVFFFNPGLLWLSSLIRAEREACCDDIVLSRIKQKASYMEALLAFLNGDNSPGPLAMGIGWGNQLRDRLKRMVNQENKRLAGTEKVILVTGLALLLAFTTLSNANPLFAVSMHRLPRSEEGNDSTNRTREKHTIALTDTAVHFSDSSYRQGRSNRIINEMRSEDKNGKKYHLVIDGNKLLAMDINGEKVKDNDLPKFEYLIRLLREKQKAYAAVLTAKLKVSNKLGNQRYIDSLLPKP